MEKKLLDDICLQLGNIHKTKNQLEDSLKSRYGSEIAEMSRFDIAERASRLHTELRCRQVAGRYEGEIIIPDEMSRGIVRGDYQFIQRDKRRTAIEVIHKDTHKLEGEIEFIMRIKGVYVIVETHVGNYKPGSKGIGKLLRKDRTDKVLGYGEAYVQKRTSMIVIIPQNLMRLANVDESNVSHFLQRGGRIVPFYTTRDQWQKDVATIKEAYTDPKVSALVHK